MALLVHLPLTGDLHNQGLAEVTYTGTPVFKTTGKIGNSAFDLSHRVTFNCPSLDGVKTFSIAFWGKVNSDTNLSTNWVDVISFTDRKSDGSVTGVFRWETCYGGTNYTNWGISVHDNGYYNISDLAGIPQATGKNIWHHIVITVDLENNEVKEYLNGVLVGTATCNGGSLTGAFHLGENNLINGEIQDVRVYSHCLSQKKISELKKALVLHYPLDNNGCGQKNLITQAMIDAEPWKSAIQGTYEVDNKKGWILAHNLLYSKSGNGANNIFSGLTYEENTQYTISFKWRDDYRTDGKTSSMYIRFKYSDGTQSEVISHKYDYWKEEILTSTAGKTVVSIVTTYGNGGQLLFTDLKLEKGTKKTPFSPIINSNLYTALGYDDGIEYDTSGYGNNGTKVGTLSYSTDSPRYLASTYFDGNTACIRTPYDAVAWQTNFTINLWFKKNELNGNKGYETLFGGPPGFEMDTRAGNSTTLSLYMASTRGGNVYSPFNLGEWYMVTMVNDGTNELYYVNGELSKTIEKKAMPSGNYFIGAWSSETRQNYKGLISDFRIYAVALSAEDIQKLYTVSASIDSNGNAYSAAYVED